MNATHERRQYTLSTASESNKVHGLFCNRGRLEMWYFAWILGVGLALAFGIINVMWLEAADQADNDR